MGHEACVHGTGDAVCFQCYAERRRGSPRENPQGNEADGPDPAPVPAFRSPFDGRPALTPAELQHRRRMLVHLTSRAAAPFRFRRS